MNEQQLFLLKAHKKAFGDDLRPEDIYSYLQSKFVLDVDDIEVINYEKTARRRTAQLTKFLQTKGPAAFRYFYDALIDAGYSHLADLLESGIDRSNGDFNTNDDGYDDDIPSVEVVLRNGGVPQKPQIHVERPELSLELNNALYKLKEKDGWVLVHGMAGSGKSILAAEVLNDAQLLHDCFPGGVFWLSLGVVDASKLLMKMQNLSALLDPDKNHPVPRNLEEARDRIRLLFSQEHPRSLLILDDLWTKEDAKHFDVRVRTLATSRNDFVTDNIMGSVTKVPLDEGFTEGQSRTILSKWTGINCDSLPAQANQIIKSCRSSPLAISMIGALLKNHSNRWEYYLNQLQSGKVSKFKSKLAYDYPNLCEAIAISVNSLPDGIKDKYMQFAIFDEDVKVPASVLGLLWDKDEIEVEDTMDEIISRSLAKRQPCSKDISYETYSVHDLQLDYLKESQTHGSGSSTLVQLHKVLIEKYSKRCQGNFALLENDGYVYWNVIDHLIAAEMVSKAVELLLDFSWINAKLKATGAPDLINNYHHVNSIVEIERAKQELSGFCHFISVNSYLLSTPGELECDLLQLALAQPFVEIVHLKAKERVLQCCSKDQFYVGWCNQPDETSEKCLLTVKHHSGPVYSCHYAQDNSDRIVSCGGDSKIKIWNCCTGKELLSLEGHTDTVFCCCFSPDCKLVVSASADNSIKLWNAENGRPVFTMRSHTNDVVCCCFSPDGKIIASCSGDRTIKLWDAASGSLLENLIGHEESVNWCCFSPDGKRLASASHDHTLKVWDIASAECLFTIRGCKDFVSFCVYHPSGERILAACQNFLQSIDANNGSLLRTVQTTSPILSVAFSPDGKFAVGAHADSTAQLWNVEVETCMGIFRGHSGWLHGICYSPDGDKIVTASADETCKVWKVESIADRAVKLRKVFDVNFEIQNGPLIIAANTAHEIQVVDGSNGNFLRRSMGLGSRITVCKLSIDGATIIVCLKSGHIKVIETNTCDELFSFVGHFGSIRDCRLSKDGMAVVTCSEDTTVKVWDLNQRISKAVCEGHSDKVTKCILFLNDTRIVSSSYDGSLKVWDIADGKCLFTCSHDFNALLSCEVSTDNQMLISTSAGSTAKLWNANTGELLHTLEGQTDCVRCAAFSLNCKMVATGSDDGTIKLWSTETGEELAACEKHKVWVTEVHFSPDDSRVVSVSDDIKWWKTDGSLVQTFFIRGNYLRQMKISRDFKRYITIDDSGQLYILNSL